MEDIEETINKEELELIRKIKKIDAVINKGEVVSREIRDEAQEAWDEVRKLEEDQKEELEEAMILQDGFNELQKIALDARNKAQKAWKAVPREVLKQEKTFEKAPGLLEIQIAWNEAWSNVKSAEKLLCDAWNNVYKTQKELETQIRKAQNLTQNISSSINIIMKEKNELLNKLQSINSDQYQRLIRESAQMDQSIEEFTKETKVQHSTQSTKL